MRSPDEIERDYLPPHDFTRRDEYGRELVCYPPIRCFPIGPKPKTDKQSKREKRRNRRRRS